MIELQHDRLTFSFPEVHEDAMLEICFERTLRIPDDDRTYSLPPGLGRFALRHVDDFHDRVPQTWIEHGGVMLPMYQAEAMWIYLGGPYSSGYPMAIKIAAGKINAVSGKPWKAGLNRRPQDYVVVPGQPWLDGYCVEKGVIRQFVAAPLGSGYSAEEQITGKAEHGGLQIAVYPMKWSVFKKIWDHRDNWLREGDLMELRCCAAVPDMGLAPGGKMHQEIYEDEYKIDDWDLEHGARCFVHICNSQAWRGITGEPMPRKPVSAKEYTMAGLPWFDYYDDKLEPVSGSKVLSALKSVAQLSKKKRDGLLDENQPVTPEKIIVLRKGLRQNQVRELAE